MNTSDLTAQLECARELLDNNNPGAALKRLNPLYKADEDNLDVIGLVLEALTELEFHDKARAVIVRAIKRQPETVDLWGRLVHFYIAHENYPAALGALEKAETILPGHYELRRLKAFVYSRQGDREAMHQQLEELIDAYPEHRHDLLIERAELYRSLSFEPAPDEAQVKEPMGLMAFAVVPLQKAVADISRALRDRPEDWRLYFKRAGFHKQLADYDSAVADFDQALAHLDEDGEDFREFLTEEREACLNGGRRERESLAESLREGMLSADDGELSLDDYMANNLIDALATRSTEDGANAFELLEAVSDDPDEAIALSVAQDIIKQAREPSSDYQPVAAREFPSAERNFCNRAAKELEQQGFTSLGDFEPVGMRQMLGKRALVRMFLSADKTTSVVAARFSPLKPAFWLWFILWVLRQWKPRNLIQLESVTTDGRFLLTSNSGGINPFNSAPDHVDALALAPDTKISALIAAHQKRLQACNAEWVKYGSVDDVLASQERLRLLKNAHRESIGFITEDELKSLLGKQYDKLAERVRHYLHLLTQI